MRHLGRVLLHLSTLLELTLRLRRALYRVEVHISRLRCIFSFLVLSATVKVSSRRGGNFCSRVPIFGPHADHIFIDTRPLTGLFSFGGINPELRLKISLASHGVQHLVAELVCVNGSFRL